MGFNTRSVNVHQFAMVPRADIPRATFNIQTGHKTTIDAGALYPILVEEVLPGDTFNLSMTAFARLSTPIFPLMDNLYIDSFFFFVPPCDICSRCTWQSLMATSGNRCQL